MAQATKTDVLLVDFFDSTRSTTTEILSLSGLTVTEADDGEIAYELLAEKRFGVLLLDLDLPKRSGLELLESLEDPPPVVIYSSYRIEPDDREHLRCKVVGNFVKPVDPTVLIETVTDVLRHGRLAA